MTIQEIKNIFGIDITKKNRTDLNVYLRTLYVQKNLPSSSFNQIGKELGYSHATLMNCYYKLDLYNQDPLFMYVKKAFQTKDNNLIIEFKRLFHERTLERTRAKNQENYIKRVCLEKPKRERNDKNDYISKTFEVPEKEHIFIVAKNLRFKKTYLNEKPLNEWIGRDWIKYYELKNN